MRKALRGEAAVKKRVRQELRELAALDNGQFCPVCGLARAQSPRLLAIAACLVPVGLVWSVVRGDKSESVKDRPQTYDEEADAKADIAAALVKAKKNNKRVLIM